MQQIGNRVIERPGYERLPAETRSRLLEAALRAARERALELMRHKLRVTAVSPKRQMEPQVQAP